MSEDAVADARGMRADIEPLVFAWIDRGVEPAMIAWFLAGIGAKILARLGVPLDALLENTKEHWDIFQRERP